MSLTSQIKRLYDKTHWFTDREAWGLFRLFAFAEAVGWTLLIGAIIYRHFDGPQAASVVTVAGRLHGLCFSLYFLFVLLTARSMAWGKWRMIFGLLAGVGPYTSLLYEQILAHHRKIRPVEVPPPEDLS